MSLIVVKSKSPFSLPALARLSDAIGTTNFQPGPVQKLVLKRALQLLDLELSHQTDEHPEFVDMINQLLTDKSN